MSEYLRSPRAGELHDHDRGLSHDLPMIVQRGLGRRGLLSLIGGVGAVALAGCGAEESTGGGSADHPSNQGPGDPPPGGGGASDAAVAEGEIPEETGGPFPADGSNGVDVLSESGVVRSDITSSFGSASGTAEGVPLTIRMKVYDLDGDDATVLSGAAVYVWHCDREGRYSLYSQGVEDQNYLRGVQVADADGLVRFTSVFPACYSGRWPHVHVEVYPDRAGIADAADAIATSQVALPEQACEAVYGQAGYEQSVTNLAQVSLAADNVFGDDAGATQLGTVTGDVTQGYAVSLAVKVDTRTTPTP